MSQNERDPGTGTDNDALRKEKILFLGEIATLAGIHPDYSGQFVEETLQSIESRVEEITREESQN